ncbi:T9SS type A sorting domain-containing protein, partial [candidate division GN15 bacterium]|nr:T9SS type A sorting domain-containing protein [candidate division GN15 bacterium]
EAPSAAGAAFSADIYPPTSLVPGPGFPTDEKWRVMTSGSLYANQNKEASTDLYLIMSTAGRTLAPGGVDTVAFAILAGDTFAEIQDAAARAQFNPTDVDDDPDEPGNLPRSFALYQNYPNPFNPSTTISFDLPARSDYTLEVFNILGQQVYRASGNAAAGRVRHVWDAAEQSSGVYLYRVTTDSYEASRKMLLLK